MCINNSDYSILGHNYVLVLPPWGRLVHWKDAATRVPWKKLFDISSLNKYVPVIEFEEFYERNGNKIDQIVFLQGYAEGWTDGKWEEKYDIRECINVDRYYRQVDGKWYVYSSVMVNHVFVYRRGFFYSYSNVYSEDLKCLSLQGESETVSRAIIELFSSKTIFIDRAEVMLHDRFGSKNYWEARRSMRYSKNLVDIADDFISSNLDSNLDEFNINLPKDWTEEKESKRDAIGGNYLSVHLRRRDFVHSHSNDVPSINDAAKQIINVSKKLSLRKVFICTDGDSNEIAELKSYLGKENIELHQFGMIGKLSDAEVSIIDQIIASKSRHFIGTHSSTFSYRIREDREIMHFPIASTFNDLCPSEKECEQPAKWTITYE